MTRHFLTLDDISTTEVQAILARAQEFKAGASADVARDKYLVLMFEKASTRTRLSFEIAFSKLAGKTLFLSSQEAQLDRGESIEDTIKVMSSMADCVVLRTFNHEIQQRAAAQSSIPIINGLSDNYHPCQILADMQTFIEHRGDISGKKVAWIGEMSNVCNSYIKAAQLFGFELAIATPECSSLANIEITLDAATAIDGADLVVTDTWFSMGDDDDKKQKIQNLMPYQVTTKLMKLAAKDALFMHCLPAYRGFEVEAAVIDGVQSVVWDEAENRMHSQQALLEFLLCT